MKESPRVIYRPSRAHAAPGSRNTVPGVLFQTSTSYFIGVPAVPHAESGFLSMDGGGLATSTPSVYLHSSVDLADKHVGCVEADGAREKPEGQDHEGRVAEVQERGDELNDVQLGHEWREKGVWGGHLVPAYHGHQGCPRPDLLTDLLAKLTPGKGKGLTPSGQ